jgi:hypothetical protein
LCSLHFTKGQLDRDPEKLNENGYEGARIRLRKDAVPDIPLAIQKSDSKDENSAISLPQKPRGAYAKRQRAEVSDLYRSTYKFIMMICAYIKCLHT